MDATEELRTAHDAIAETYAEVLVDVLDRMPVDRAVLGLFCDLVTEHDAGTAIGDIGSGSAWLTPFLRARGLAPHGIDLSPEMVRVARRANPGVPFDVGDVRSLPFADASLAGVVCWYSLMYLAPADRHRAFGELARVVRPGGYFVTGYKIGDGERRRGGARLGVAFDVYWLPPEEMERNATAAGFETVFTARRPAGRDAWEEQPQGYLIARRSTQ